MLQQLLIFCGAYIVTGLSCAARGVKCVGPAAKEKSRALDLALLILLWPFTVLPSSDDNRFIAYIFLFVVIIGIGEMVHYVW